MSILYQGVCDRCGHLYPIGQNQFQAWHDLHVESDGECPLCDSKKYSFKKFDSDTHAILCLEDV